MGGLERADDRAVRGARVPGRTLAVDAGFLVVYSGSFDRALQ